MLGICWILEWTDFLFCCISCLQLFLVLVGIWQEFLGRVTLVPQQVFFFCVVGVEANAPEDIVPLIVDKFNARSECFGVLDPITASVISWECFPNSLCPLSMVEGRLLLC